MKVKNIAIIILVLSIGCLSRRVKRRKGIKIDGLSDNQNQLIETNFKEYQLGFIKLIGKGGFGVVVEVEYYVDFFAAKIEFYETEAEEKKKLEVERTKLEKEKNQLEEEIHKLENKPKKLAEITGNNAEMEKWYNLSKMKGMKTSKEMQIKNLTQQINKKESNKEQNKEKLGNETKHIAEASTSRDSFVMPICDSLEIVSNPKEKSENKGKITIMPKGDQSLESLVKLFKTVKKDGSSAIKDYNPLNDSFRNNFAIPAFLAMTTAVEAVHDKKIIHGDIKPQNFVVFQPKNGVAAPMLIDFGGASKTTGPVTKGVTFSFLMTAPDMREDSEYIKDPKNDVYSLGIVFATMISDLMAEYYYDMKTDKSKDEFREGCDELNEDCIFGLESMLKVYTTTILTALEKVGRKIENFAKVRKEIFEADTIDKAFKIFFKAIAGEKEGNYESAFEKVSQAAEENPILTKIASEFKYFSLLKYIANNMLCALSRRDDIKQVKQRIEGFMQESDNKYTNLAHHFEGMKKSSQVAYAKCDEYKDFKQKD